MMGYSPCAPEGGQALRLLPYARCTQRAGTRGAPGGAASATRPKTRPGHSGGPLPGTRGAVLRLVSPHALWHQQGQPVLLRWSYGP